MSQTSEGSGSPGEHAVLIEWEDHEPPLESVFEAEDALMRVFDSNPGLGEVDGNEVGSGSATIYLYGGDCAAMWNAIEATVRGFLPPPTKVIVRPGGPETVGREIVI